ncbi:uncharacterized protein LOC131353447 [Hemibagrus wyckioides]|uniref:uncharacterized protein LOC131353447 n=1 Tax=Hemibagrus wyckioides TaxID=337641 RepID=UPI00266BA971|nr:uncharacterized protein LOC131353447 [Hemibagrus wyckioides]
MEEQGVGKKEELDWVLLGDVEIDMVLQRGMDEDEVLEGTIDVGKGQSHILEERVYMGRDQTLEGVGVGQFQHEILESSNDVVKAQNDVLDGGMDVIKVQAVVLEDGSDKDKFQGKILEDSVDRDKVRDKVLDGGMEVNKIEDKGGVEVDKFLEGGLDMDQVRVLEGSMDADKIQDEILKGGVEMDKFQHKVLKHDVDHSPEDNFVKGNVDVTEIYDTVVEDSVERVIDEVPEKAVAIDKVRNKMEDNVDMGKTLDEALKGSVNINENGWELKEAHGTVLEDNVNMEVLNARQRMDSLRCHVRITTRHNLQLRMANHTARDVYVRLLGHGERITGSGKEAYDDYEEDNLLLDTSLIIVDLY